MSRKVAPVPEDPLVRARNRAREVLATEYDLGHRTLTSFNWAREVFARMRENAPTVPEEVLIRALAGKTQSHSELLINHAFFLEYNHTAALARAHAPKGSSERSAAANPA
ncbi:MAG TPA: hypothetical protein VNZ52_03675 [Candidatus Thermoplasmatota archaeon]|nr:hypothetical protein [Candidatus Thermoplasmatota archaeon]